MSRPRPGGLVTRCQNRDGQALLMAVLLMSVILMVGILFAAVVSYNQGQSARHLDMLAAQLQAEAGVNYASSMLENSPQGADWRPRFVPYTGTGAELPNDPTTWPKDPAKWPNPPAMYEDGSVDFNFYGPDGIQGTDDDYYSDFEIVRGWFPLRHGTPAAPGGFIHAGYFRFPDPNAVATSVGGVDNPLIGRGYFLLQVTYDPDPPYEPGDPTNEDTMSGYTKIVAIGRAVQESNAFRRLVAYKPIGLMDNMRWVTNKSGQASTAVLGVRPNEDMDRSGTCDVTGIESLYSYLPGPIRSEVPLYWAGSKIGNGAGNNPSTVFRLATTPQANEGYLRDDFMFAPQGLYGLDDPDGSSGAETSVDGTNTVLPLSLAPEAASAPDRVHVGSRDVTPLAPVDLDARDPISGDPRYEALTRDSGETRCLTVDDDTNHLKANEDPINLGLYGAGAGMYINNFDDVQYKGNDGASNLDQLQADWLKTATTTGPSGGATGWNALYTTYTPPAAEVEFFPTEAAVLAASGAGSYSNTPPTTPGTLWWPRHTAGEPGIKITRHDQRWRRADNTSGTWVVGADSGQNVMVIDYPKYPNAVILAEGNVRVKGVLPLRNQVTRVRTYDVTVVSNATIYIDGQLMTAQDVYGRAYGTNDPAYAPVDTLGGPAPALQPGPVLDENTAKVALLAKDSVCLNPTQLVPQLTSGLVTAAPDDSANPSLADQHWELFPESTGQCYSQWRFGWPDIDWNGDGYGDGTPGTATAAGVNVNLVPLQAGADPGPSGMGMTLYNEPAGTQTPFTFAGTGGSIDPYTFVFVPPGALLGGLPTPAPYASNAILPYWQPPGSTPLWSGGAWVRSFTNPSLPYNITAGIVKTPGQANAVQLRQRDPQLGAGSTPYVIKKWKIEESTGFNVGAITWQLPRGAVHAKVNALMYAQRGSWFVIPGSYFDPNAKSPDQNGNGSVDWQEQLYASRFLRYNYEITVRGSIAEDHTAPIGAVQAWTRQWAYPVWNTSGANPTLSWGTIRYQFDERLRLNRDQGLTALNTVGGQYVRSTNTITATPEGSLPKLPCLPSSPTLIYTGGTP